MKKRISIMAGLLAMALVGSAQAATMFAVQNSGGTDQATISDTGAINTGGHITTNNPSTAGGYIGIGTATPLTPFHVQVSGSTVASAGFTYTFTNTGNILASRAPNFTFFRNNDPLGTGATNGALPRADDTLGLISFGTQVSGAGRAMAQIVAKTEGTPTTAVQAGYLYFLTSYDNAGAYATAERMRITSVGNVGINTTTPTSKLAVVGLPYYSSNANALAGGLTAGAFYKCGGTAILVAPTDTASQALCVVY